MFSCENIQDCSKSLQEIFVIDVKTLDRIKNEIQSQYERSSSYAIDSIMEKFRLKIKKRMSFCFFHFSWTLNIDTYKKGILTLPQMMTFLINEVSNLYGPLTEDDAIRKLESKSHLSSRLRINNHMSGPFGYLIKEHGFTEDSDSVAYIEVGEFMTDIISAFDFDISIYQSSAKSIVVKYAIHNLEMNEQIKYIIQALEYVTFENEKEQLKHMTSTHDNKGELFPAQDILTINEI